MVTTMRTLIFLTCVLAATASCTFGQVVNDKTDTPIPSVYLDFHEVHSHTHYYVRADAQGTFAFDPEVANETTSRHPIALAEGDYEVTASTSDFCPGAPHDFSQLAWDHFSTMAFHHSYDTKCKGSSGNEEPCEAYQIRLSSKDPFFDIDPGSTLPKEPTSDDHQGTRVITLYKSLAAPAPLPC